MMNFFSNQENQQLNIDNSLLQPGEVNELKDMGTEIVMNNYFSIGMDARICLDFHNFRNKNPELFKNKFINYGWYGAIGLKSAITHWTTLKQIACVKVDGKQLPLSSSLLALIILNIPSYGGGADVWGQKSKKYKKQYINDGIFEVVGVRGAFHFGQIQSKMAQGVRLAQGSKVEIFTTEEIEAQVDGEPFKIKPSEINLQLHVNKGSVLLNSNKDKLLCQKYKLDYVPEREEYTGESILKEIKKIQYEYDKKYGKKVKELEFIQNCVLSATDPDELLKLCNERMLYLKNRINPNQTTVRNKIV